MGVKGGRPGEEIEPTADALIAKMDVSAIVSWVLLTIDVNFLRNKRMRNWDRVDHLTNLGRTDLDNAFKRSSIVASRRVWVAIGPVSPSISPRGADFSLSSTTAGC